jgi:hypothetical protein
MYQDNKDSKTPQARLEAYLRLRRLAHETKPVNVGVTDVTDEMDASAPFGILMDISLPQGNATIVAFISGDASFYTSTGGGVIGGIGHEKVRNAARNFVISSAKYLDKMEVTTAYPLPEPGKVRFYVLTPTSIFTHEANEVDLRKNEFTPLYAAGHQLLNALLAAAQPK